MDTVNRPVQRKAIRSTMLQRLFNSRLTQALSGQALVSAFHFSINLLLLPLFSAHDFGVFALSFVLALFAAAINNALISTPLSIYTPVIKSPEQRHQQEALFNALNAVFFSVVLFIGIGFFLRAEDYALTVALFVASYSTRQFSRSFAYARLKAEIPAKADSLYVLVAVLGCGSSLMIYGADALPFVLLALACGNFAASALEFYLLRDAWKLPTDFSGFASYATYWPQIRWSLIGAVTTLLMGQAHSIIVTSRIGPEAFAPLAAGGVLFGPIRVALTTWQNMSKPQLAIDLNAKHFDQVASHIKKTTLIMILALSGISLALWLAWPWIDALLYAHKYHQEPMGFIVSIWTLITLFVTFNSPISAVLQALADFKVLAIASMIGACISTVIVMALLYSHGATVTLYGSLAAEVFLAAYLVFYLNRCFKTLS